MTDEELIAAVSRLNTSRWPAQVSLITRLEITKARLTLAWKQVEAMPNVEESYRSLFRGDSNGAGAMLRCVDEYSHGFQEGKLGPNFDKEWAVSILRTHEAILKEMINE